MRTLIPGMIGLSCLLAAGYAHGDEPAPVLTALVANGSFEELASNDPTRPAGWYYLQQGCVVEAAQASAGARFLRFTNHVPGRVAQLQQHIKLDGSKVRALDVAVDVALRDVAPGQSLAERPAVRLFFYDADDAEIGQELLGPWGGTQPWSHEATRVTVPVKTQLLLVVVGLGGATGEVDFDRLAITPATINPTALPVKK